MPAYDDIKQGLGNWLSGRDYLSRVISGKNPDGSDFVIGSAAPPGESGSSVLYGEGAPSDTLGNDGDTYIDTANDRLYGPKVAGSWPDGFVSLGGSSVGVPTYVQVAEPERGDTPWVWFPIRSTGNLTGERVDYAPEPAPDTGLLDIFDVMLFEGHEARSLDGTSLTGDPVVQIPGVLGVFDLEPLDTSPTFLEDAGEGVSGLRFDGDTDCLVGTLPASIPQPWEVLTVAKFSATTLASRKAFWGSRNATVMLVVETGSSPRPLYVFAGSFQTIGSTDDWNDALRLWRTHGEGASSFVQRTGASLEAGNPGTLPLETNFAVAGDGLGSRNAPMDWCASVILTGTPTTEQVTAFAERYGL